MKNIIALLACIALTFSAIAQNSPSDKLYEKMNLEPGITSLSFSKSMLDAVNLDFDEEEKKVTGDLHQVKLMIYQAPEDAEPIDFRSQALKLLPLSKYKEVDADEQGINNNDGTTDIRILNSGRKVKECHILIQGETNGLLISFFGDFKVENIKELAEKANNYQ